MTTLGIYVFNSTRNAWLQDDGTSWGGFTDAFEFDDEDFAEAIRVRESGDDVTYTMAALS
jgi:hypothetical protein